ncbi:MAG: hypothetical protein KDC68_01845 [Gelidibacter sp.]|nr:hypothetical protein [Gelidibacter sp.]
MEAKFFTLKEVALHNNCPECFSREGLQLTFKQRFVENNFYKAISSDTVPSLICNVCHTEIFPARWTDAIDSVYDYHKKAATPKPTSFKLKKLSWILIAIAALIFTVAILFVVRIF